MQQVIDIAKALGDESRLRALLSLRDGELCLCQIIDLLDLAPSTVSKHLSILHRAGLVNKRKQGRWHYFRLPGREAPPVVRQALRWVSEGVADDAAVNNDIQSVSKIREQALDELCDCYRSSGGRDTPSQSRTEERTWTRN